MDAPVRVMLPGKGLMAVQYFVPSGGGRPLLAGARPGRIGCWDASTGQVLWQAELGDVGCFDLVFADTGEGSAVLAAATRRGIGIWDAATGRLRCAPLSGEISGSRWDVKVQSLGVGRLPDGRSFFAGAGYCCDVLRWDAATGEPVGRPLHGHKYSVSSVEVVELPNNTTIIVSGAEDETIVRWDAASGRQVGQTIAAGTDAAKFASLLLPDGRLLVAECYGGDPIYCRDAATGNLVSRPVTTGPPQQWISNIELVMAEGRPRLVASPRSGDARQWDVFSGRELEPLAGGAFAVFRGNRECLIAGLRPSPGEIYIGPVEVLQKLGSAASSVALQELQGPERPYRLRDHL
ncbi:WD40 repeat domain-containing protein [Actinocorallia populi]|uniref:WD40 repeat domain-containing protein n=1 Tax=Actinocorallia populi TaxID=2079200 RepID=UPI0013009D1C|nr:PQQ-binding-like beta-propeller repeat protein [Actinocorallia populi]